MSISDGTVLKIVASIIWTDGNIMQNVFNAVVTGAGTPWDAEDLIDDAVVWIEAIYTNLLAFISDECDGSQVQGYEWDAVDGDWDEFGSDNITVNFTGASDQLPRGAAALINLKTTDPDVSGKKYFGGSAEGAAADGLWNASYITALIAAGLDWSDDFVGSVSGATWTPGVWSVAGTVFKAAGNTYIIPTIPAYQRRRKRGIGI